MFFKDHILFYFILFLAFLWFWPTAYATNYIIFHIVKIQSVYVAALPKIVSYSIKLYLSKDPASSAFSQEVCFEQISY